MWLVMPALVQDTAPRAKGIALSNLGDLSCVPLHSSLALQSLHILLLSLLGVHERSLLLISLGLMQRSWVMCR